jgi:hypothetical protein
VKLKITVCRAARFSTLRAETPGADPAFLGTLDGKNFGKLLVRVS